MEYYERDIDDIISELQAAKESIDTAEGLRHLSRADSFMNAVIQETAKQTYLLEK